MNPDIRAWAGHGANRVLPSPSVAVLPQVTYVLYGTIVTQLGDVDDVIALGPGNSVPVSQYVETSFDYQYAWRGWIVLILFGFFVTCRVVATAGVIKLNYQTR